MYDCQECLRHSSRHSELKIIAIEFENLATHEHEEIANFNATLLEIANTS